MTAPRRTLGAALAITALLAPLAACSDDEPAASSTTPPSTTAPDSTTSTTSAAVDGTALPVGLVELLELYCLWPEGPEPTTVEEVLGERVEVTSGPAPESAIPQIPEAERVPGLEILHAGALTGTCDEDPAVGRTALVIGVLGGPTDRLDITAATAPVDAAEGDLAPPDPAAATGLDQLGGWAERLSMGDGGIAARVDPAGETVDGLASAERRNEVFAYVVGIEEGDEPFRWWFQTAQRTGPDPDDAIEWRLATGSTG